MIWHLSSQPDSSPDLTLEQLQLIIALSEHVVLAVQQTITGPHKKQLATRMLTDLLRECDLPAYPALIDVAIESSVKVMRIFEQS